MGAADASHDDIDGTDDRAYDEHADAEPLGWRPTRWRYAATAASPAASALVASAVAIAYLARAAQTGAALDWVLRRRDGRCSASATSPRLVDARTPLLVADAQGVRIRLGRTWRGLPWGALAQVEHRPRRGLLRDGRLVVVAHNLAAADRGARPRRPPAVPAHPSAARRPVRRPARPVHPRRSVPATTSPPRSAALAGDRSQIVEARAGRAEEPSRVDAGARARRGPASAARRRAAEPRRGARATRGRPSPLTAPSRRARATDAARAARPTSPTSRPTPELAASATRDPARALRGAPRGAETGRRARAARAAPSERSTGRGDPGLGRAGPADRPAGDPVEPLLIDDFAVEPADGPGHRSRARGRPHPARAHRRPARRAHPHPSARHRVDRGRRLRALRRRLLRPRPPAHAGPGARHRRARRC